MWRQGHLFSLVVQDILMSKSQIYKLIEQGSFPKQIKVRQRVSAWLSGDIETWVEQRVSESTQEEQLKLPLGD